MLSHEKLDVYQRAVEFLAAVVEMLSRMSHSGLDFADGDADGDEDEDEDEDEDGEDGDEAPLLIGTPPRGSARGTRVETGFPRRPPCATSPGRRFG
jgi:hypothetical protein